VLIVTQVPRPPSPAPQFRVVWRPTVKNQPESHVPEIRFNNAGCLASPWTMRICTNHHHPVHSFSTETGVVRCPHFFSWTSKQRNSNLLVPMPTATTTPATRVYSGRKGAQMFHKNSIATVDRRQNYSPHLDHTGVAGQEFIYTNFLQIGTWMARYTP
jgi:hypothetical protein